jgi:hypothetical protein
MFLAACIWSSLIGVIMSKNYLSSSVRAIGRVFVAVVAE